MKKRNNATEKFTLDAGKNFLLYTFITMKRVNQVYLQLSGLRYLKTGLVEIDLSPEAEGFDGGPHEGQYISKQIYIIYIYLSSNAGA